MNCLTEILSGRLCCEVQSSEPSAVKWHQKQTPKVSCDPVFGPFKLQSTTGQWSGQSGSSLRCYSSNSFLLSSTHCTQSSTMMLQTPNNQPKYFLQKPDLRMTSKMLHLRCHTLRYSLWTSSARWPFREQLACSTFFSSCLLCSSSSVAKLKYTAKTSLKSCFTACHQHTESTS